MSTPLEPEFSKWRRRLWPVHRIEFKKVIPLLLLKFLATFNFHILSTTKDTLAISTAGSGAEVIPIIKGYIVLPCALLVLLVYTKFSNKLSLIKLVSACLIPFIVFFLFFGFILYPYSEYFIPVKLCAWLENLLGPTKMHWIAVVKYWMNSLFYVVSELWGQVVIMLVFWTFVNSMSRVSEAKRYYNLLSGVGNLAPMLAGTVVVWVVSKGAFIHNLKLLMAITSGAGMSIMAILWWINRYVLTDQRFFSAEEQTNMRKEKPKLSIRESLKFICSSKYLGCIALMVVGYGLCINLVEVTWKANLKLQFPNSNDLQAFLGKLTFFLGLCPAIVAVFISGNFLRKFGWFRSALLTPILLGFTGLLFLGCYMGRDYLGPATALLGITPLFLIVMLGAVQNVVSKSMKYAIFDPTKEMAFIPLDSESKVKGKAAIDVVGSRLGKSGSAWIQAGLIDLFGAGSILNVTGIISPIIFVVLIAWIFAVRVLSKEFAVLANEAS